MFWLLLFVNDLQDSFTILNICFILYFLRFRAISWLLLFLPSLTWLVRVSVVQHLCLLLLIFLINWLQRLFFFFTVPESSSSFSAIAGIFCFGLSSFLFLIFIINLNVGVFLCFSLDSTSFVHFFLTSISADQ